jgi:hypothetical protein
MQQESVALNGVAVQQIKSILMHGSHYEYLKFSIYTMTFYTNTQLHFDYLLIQQVKHTLGY